VGIKILQTNFTSGVIDDRLAAREDLAAYYNGLQDGLNIVINPLGGASRRGGLKHLGELAKVMSETDLSGVTVTAPNGGTTGNIKDDDDTTYLTTSSNLSTTDPFVVAHFDFGAATDVDAVDVINYKLSSGTLDDEFYVQYSTDDASWSDYGEAFNWSASDRSRRRRTGSTVSAQYWRVARIGSTSVAATATIAEVKFWSEGSTLSNARLLPFAYSSDDAYIMAVSGGNMDVYKNETFTGSISINHTSAQLSVLNWTQSLDTMLLFHRAVEPPKIFKQGSDDEFDFRAAPFTNIPKNDFGAGTGGVNEVQTLNYGGGTSTDKFTISLEGYRTATIATANASSIQSALRALDNTSASGITVSAVSNGFEVTFGGDDGSRPWAEMDVDVLEGNLVWSVSRTTRGEYEGEDIMSDTRGWPRCGVFYQERLYLGGITGVPNALLASKVSEFYDFDTDEDLATRALLFRVNTDQLGSIYQIVSGRNLSIFTNDTEFYIPTEPVDENAVLKQATRVGIKEGMRPYEVDGALIFVQADGSSWREFLFVDTEQSYQANNISRLANQLIEDPVDIALRKAVNTNESDLLIAVLDDGTVTALSTLRLELVNAFGPWSLSPRDDTFLAVGVDAAKRVYFITERTINGTARRFIEKLADDLLLDGGGLQTATYEEFTATDGQTDFTWSFDNPGSADAIIVRKNGGRLSSDIYSADLGTKTVTLDSGADAGDTIRVASGIKTISNLDHLAGETVQTYIDGSPGEDYTVTAGGVLTLDDYADTSVQYGFFFDVSGKLMPLRIEGAETLAGKKVRCYRALLELWQTGHIQIRANTGSWREVPLSQYDSSVLDKSMDELLYTGTAEIEGLTGWAEGAPFEFRQTVPAPLSVLGITREVSI
jgi:hypothetical protein